MSDFDWSPYAPYITRAEMACRHTGECEMDKDFLDWLLLLRLDFGFPMVFTSGYRDGDDGAHGLGLACDILVNGALAHRLIGLAYKHDAYGIGARQHGAHDKRFVHLDRWGKRLEDGTNLTRFWTYPDAE